MLSCHKKKKKGSDGESYTDYSDSEAGSEIGDSGTASSVFPYSLNVRSSAIPLIMTLRL